MITFTSVSVHLSKMEMLAVPVSEDGILHDEPGVQALVARATALKEFSGEKDQQVTLHDPLESHIRRCLVLGMGPQKKLCAESFRTMAGKAVQAAINAKCRRLVVAVPLNKSLDMDPRTVITALLEGALLGNHRFDKYKKAPKQTPLTQIALLVPAPIARRFKALIEPLAAVCRATTMAREWVNTPSNDKVPAQLAKTLVAATKKQGIQTSVLDPAQLQKKKMGALMAVAVGSHHPPRLVEMRYAPKGAKKTIVLVGKGVTFDTGGINLKPSTGLNTMKIDMSGAAAVAATMTAVKALKLKHRVVGVTPLVENMCSGSATRPGDIVTSFSGKTVEIGNTDAEGRLILIDAMAYAIKKYQPDVLIDMATLTGACMVALGDKIAGVFSPDDELAQAIVASGEATHERCWRMPLPDDYKTLLKSELADINNLASTRYGGAITAALFLSEFVGDTRWAHIDIAGPAFSTKAGAYCTAGATGFGVRLLCDLIQKL
jgi:leucyl aminopeptidase